MDTLYEATQREYSLLPPEPALHMTIKRTLLFVVLVLCPWAAWAETATVYFNGDILTMEGDSPRYVEAVVVKGDEIAFAGDLKEARTEAGEEAEMHDLKGHTLLPGFIDTWGHFALVAQDTLGVNVSYFAEDPPKTKAQLLEKLRSEGKPFNGWLVGTGYAEAMLSDGALTLADLDEAFPDQPVLIENISTLTGMANSAGLKKLGITKATKAVGGFIPVDPKTGELTGELIGDPYLNAVTEAVGKYPQETVFETYRKAQEIWFSNGLTTAQSYEATVDDMDNLRAAWGNRLPAPSNPCSTRATSSKSPRNFPFSPTFNTSSARAASANPATRLCSACKSRSSCNRWPRAGRARQPVRRVRIPGAPCRSITPPGTRRVRRPRPTGQTAAGRRTCLWLLPVV